MATHRCFTRPIEASPQNDKQINAPPVTGCRVTLPRWPLAHPERAAPRDFLASADESGGQS